MSAAHDELDIRPLSEAARDRYTEDWQRAEQRFLDDPELAAREADRIVRDVLDDRGYPNDDFDTQAAAVSVDHPTVVERYRHGHEMLHGDGKRKRKGKDDRDWTARRTCARRWSTSGRCSSNSSSRCASPRVSCARVSRNHGGARRSAEPGAAIVPGSRGCSSVG